MSIFPSCLQLLRSPCCFDLLLLLRCQYLCLGLEPVAQGESVNPAALLIQLVGTLADFS